MSALVIALIILLVRLASSWYNQHRLLRSLKIVPRATEPDPSDPSLYELIREQAEEDPDEALDYTPFPELPTDDDGTSYLPGAHDIVQTGPFAVLERERDQIVGAIHAARIHRLNDWRTLELYLRDVDPNIYQEAVLRQFPLKRITDDVREIFQEVALMGTDYTAVKWGIIVGCIGATRGEIEELMELARHAELTSYVCGAIVTEIKRIPDIIELLPKLLPITDGWGLFQAYHYIASNPRLIARPEIQRAAMIHGMRNGSYARMHLAGRFLTELDLPRLQQEAPADPELAEALVDLLEVIMLEPEAPGMIAGLSNGEDLLDSFVAMLGRLHPSIDALRGTRAVCILLGTESLSWPSRRERMEGAYTRFTALLDPEILTAAITEDNHRWDALRIILEIEYEVLLPVVLEDFRRRPDAMNIEVLGRLGEEEHLRALIGQLPDEAAIARRSKLSLRELGTPAVLEESAAYAAIIRHLGKLGSREDLAKIKTAAVDVHPWVRAAAMIAMRNIQRWTLDAESGDLVQRGVDDTAEVVSETAKETAAFHNLKVTIDGVEGVSLSDDFGVSLN